MRAIAVLLVALVTATGAHGQTHRDPLSNREVELMRDSAQEPKQRIDLLIGFARERVMDVEQLHAAAKDAANKSGKLDAVLSELADLIDELDDNLVAYSKHGEDLRHPLRQVLLAEGEFQQKLKAVEDTATAPEKQHISVSLEDATDSLQSSMESAKAMLAAQIEKRGEEKDKQKLDRQEAKAKEGHGLPEQ
jgi:hypothetical protein